MTAVRDASADRPPDLPGRRQQPLRRIASPALWGPLIVFVLVVGAWQSGVFHAIFGFKTFTVPYPSAIVEGFPETWPRLSSAVIATVPAAIAGYVLGMVVGLGTAGLLLLYTPRFAARLVPVLASANALPIAAVAPLLALWVGSGMHLKVLVVAFMCTPTMIVYGVRGLTSVDPMALELMASYEAKPRTLFRVVRVPNALPFVLTAMKSCVVLALIGTIVTEVVTGFQGLGFVIVESLGAFRTVTGWLALLTIAMLGIGWYLLVELLERIVVPWEAAARQRG
jgi:NitT/TauT family transport system permease protein